MTEKARIIYDERPEDEEGKFYLELPFGGREEVTEEKYLEETEKRDRYNKQEQEKIEKQQAIYDALKAGGYNDIQQYGLHEIQQGGYAERLLAVLQQYQVKTIGEAVSATKYISSKQDTEQSTAIALISNLHPSVTIEKDSYLSSLDALFARCEAIVERERVPFSAYEEFLRLFQIGHITNPEYYQRFEELKRTDKTWYYRRLFTYGRTFADKVPEGVEPQKQQYIDYNEIRLLSGVLFTNELTLEEIFPDPEERYQILVKNYKQIIKEKMGGNWDPLYTMTLRKEPIDLYEAMSAEEQQLLLERGKKVSTHMPSKDKWQSMLTYERNWIIRQIELVEQVKVLPFDPIKSRQKNESYNPVKSSNMQRYYGFSRDELNVIIEETKEEFVKEFLLYFTDKSFKDIEHDSGMIHFEQLSTVWMVWENAAPQYGYAIEEARTIVEQGLIRFMEEGIALFQQKIADVGEKRTYRNGIQSRRHQLDEIYHAMVGMGVEHEVMHRWKKEGASYKKTLQGNKKLAYAAMKKEQVQKKHELPDENGPEVYQKVLDIVKQKLPTAAYGLLARTQEKSMGALPSLPNWKFTKLIHNRVIFQEGLYSYMKALIPDEQERKTFWEDIKRDAWKSFLTEVQGKLMNADTADHKSHLLLKPILYQLKKVGVSATDLGVDRRTIRKNYFSYAKNHTIDETKGRFLDIEKYIGGASKKEGREIHNQFYSLSMFLYSVMTYQIHLLHRRSKKSKSEEIMNSLHINFYKHNMEHFAGQYPGDYLMVLAGAHRFPDEMEKLLPEDFLAHIISIYQKSEQLKKQFFAIEVQKWVEINAIPGGKLQRVIEEQCADIEDKRKAIAHAVQYIIDHMDDLVLKDLRVMLLGRESMAPLSEPSQIMIRELVQQLLEKWKEKFSPYLLSNEESNLDGKLD